MFPDGSVDGVLASLVMYGRRVVCLVMKFPLLVRFCQPSMIVARHFGAPIGKRLCLLSDGARNSEISRLQRHATEATVGGG